MKDGCPVNVSSLDRNHLVGVDVKNGGCRFVVWRRAVDSVTIVLRPIYHYHKHLTGQLSGGSSPFKRKVPVTPGDESWLFGFLSGCVSDVQ